MLFNIFGGAVKEAPSPAESAQKSQNRADSIKSVVADLVPTPVVAIDRDYKVTYVNGAAASVAGRESADCIGAFCYELFRTTHCGTAECRCGQAMGTGSVSIGETVASPAGKEIPIRYTATPLRETDGTIVGAVEFIVDITEETRVSAAVDAIAMQALEGFLDERASEDGFSGNNAQVVQGLNQVLDSLVGHLDAMPSPALIVDRDFTVRFINEAGATVAGLSREQAKGRKCMDLFKAGDCGTSRCALGRAMSTGRTETSETDVHPQGLDLEITYSGVPIRNARGEIVGAMEIVTDQTQMKKAMRSADEKVEYLNAVPTPILVVDRDLTIKFINPAGAGVVGRTSAECVGQKCYELFNTGDCRNAGCAVMRAMKSDQVVTSDTVAQLPSGPTPIRYTGRALKDETGAVVGALEYVLDISKELEITDELTALAQAAVTGNLSMRANTEKFDGNYRKIVEGVNETVEAILQPINEAATVLEKVAQRQLDIRVTGDYKGEHAALKDNINQAVENLDVSLTQVAEATEQVTSASNQISAGSQSLAEGANEQSSSLEEVSSSLEEMASMTRQNADNASEAKSLSESSRSSAEKGNEVMSKMSDAMDRIKSSSDETAKIIKTIDEIAFQTNLLALNAAVEAARAGEAGKGFAVVAEEVRNLAQRSAEAAKVTANMIEESQRNADGGVKTAKEVGEILGEIVVGAAKVNDITSEIAAASEEQAKGIDQVSVAVAQMSKITQQNAANSEESASAAEELASQSEELMSMVSTFALSAGVKSRGERTPAESMRGAMAAGFVSAVASGPAPSNGNGRKKLGAVSALTPAGLKPQQVIPLDEDDEIDF